MKEKQIIVRHKVWGMHFFPAAKIKECYRDVEYLGNPHVHQFSFEVAIKVEHDNRQIEFFQFQKILDHLIRKIWNPLSDNENNSLSSTSIVNFVDASCERIAERLLNQLVEQQFPIVYVAVFEDEQFGAKVFNNTISSS